jgi:hypothetical protein
MDEDVLKIEHASPKAVSRFACHRSPKRARHDRECGATQRFRRTEAAAHATYFEVRFL